MLVIVGLGNPGKKYASTYHNVGFNVVDLVAKKYGEDFKSELLDCEIATFFVGEQKVMLVKPQTFMNNSGFAVSAIIRKFKLNPAKDLMVISDDIDILPGKIRIKSSSSGSTHNGIRSIVEQLGTNEFMRMKVSIGPKAENITLGNYVVSRIKNSEVVDAINNAVEAVSEFIESLNLEKVMQKYNS